MVKSVFSVIKANYNSGRRKSESTFDDVENLLLHIDDELEMNEYGSIYNYLIAKTIKEVNASTDPRIICEEIDEKFPRIGAHKLGDALSLYFKYDDRLRKNIYIQNLYFYIITHTSRIDVLYFALDVFSSLYFVGVDPLPDKNPFFILSMYAPLTKISSQIYKALWEADDNANIKKDYKYSPKANDKFNDLELNKEFVDKYLTEPANPESIQYKLKKSFKPQTLYSTDYNSSDKDFMKIEQASKLLSRLYYCDPSETKGYIAQADEFFLEFREGKKNNAKTLADSLLEIKGLDKLHLFKVALEIFFNTSNVTVLNVALCLFYELPFYIENNSFWSDVENMVYCTPLASKALQLLSRNPSEAKFVLNIVRLGQINITHVALKTLILMTQNIELKLTKSDFDIIVNKSWRRAMRKEESIIAIYELYRIPTRIKQNLLTKQEYALIKEYLQILVNTDSRHNVTELSYPYRFFERYIPIAKKLGIDLKDELTKSYQLFFKLTNEEMASLPTPLTESGKKKTLEILKAGIKLYNE